MRIGAFDVTTLGQFVDLRGRHLRRLAEIEIIQRLHAGQACILDPPGDRVAFAFLQLRGQQSFQVALIGLSLFGGYISQWGALIGHSGQAQ